MTSEHSRDAARVEVPNDHPTIVAAHGEERASAVGRTAARVAVFQAILNHFWRFIFEWICFQEKPLLTSSLGQNRKLIDFVAFVTAMDVDNEN